MSLKDVKISAYSKPVSALSNNPSQDGVTAEELKAWFDSNANNEIKSAINTIVDFLSDFTNGERIKGIRINSDNVIEITTDGVRWQATGSSGHVIIDKNGQMLPQRSRLKFVNGTITDDGTQTIIEGVKGDKGDPFTYEDLTDEQKEEMRGLQGERGPIGKTIVPNVDDDGIMSFTVQDTAIAPNNVNVRGPQGPQGVQGPMGPQGGPGPQGIQGVAGVQGPMGPAGSKGEAATIRVGRVTTGETASVINSGTVNDAVLDFVLAKGEKGEKGDTGERGPQGLQGLQGLQGPQGVSGGQGPAGPAGPQGPAGIQGVQGPMGPQGERGNDGADGKSFVIQDIFATVGELKAAFPTGNEYAYMVSADDCVYIWSENNNDWANLGQLQGPMGPQGIQGVAGGQGPAGPEGPEGPEGPQGPAGDAATITIGSVTTGENVSVVNSGTVNDAVLDFVLAKGEKGEKGEKGDKGDTGPMGPAGERGETGSQGIQGIQGVQGIQGEMGPQGPTGPEGPAGRDGQSAYQAAVAGGYSGTESAFNAALGSIGIYATKVTDGVTGNIAVLGADGNYVDSGLSVTEVGDKERIEAVEESVADVEKDVADIQSKLDDYLPLTGGALTGDIGIVKDSMPSVVLSGSNGDTRIYKNTDSADHNGSMFADGDGTGKSLELNLDCTKDPANSIRNILRQNDGTVTEYQIFGQHNKPYGTYTGTGSAAAREIDIVDTTALGNRCAMLVNGGGATVLVTVGGAFGVTHEGAAAFIKYEECNFTNGKLVLKTANNYVNMAKMFYYRVL